ncbi:competence type IV pilus minor pilin ComGF [Kordia zhangzhouensis]|uniref:competence type IV pilus minor pilin ComGF n=1 Tax=Kordia zhangzhouensis TaxID=1620405 RepID=UPI0006294504|nr:competence type IV pilus minor pilin ComGF [Kordia zhangzhouensis]
MRFNHKYKAFTLTETVFGLIISSVLIGVIYTVFTSFNKQFIIFQKQQLITNDYTVFNTTFNEDLYKAVTLDYSDETLHLKRYDETEIYYSFKNDTIKRAHNAHVETLFSKVISCTFEKKEHHFAISLKLQLHDEIIDLNYYKKNTLNQTINTAFIEEMK